MTKHPCLLSDIDDCADQPCQNGGNYTDAVNDYTCNCVPGYTENNYSIGGKFASIFSYFASLTSPYNLML